VLEVLDSDDEHPTMNPHIKVENGDIGKKMVSPSGIDMAPTLFDKEVKDKDERYMITQKVKVDFIEYLTEVPACLLIPPEGMCDTTYVIDLNNDKKWQELDMKSKKKRLDCFLKHEVCLT
jgi:hypothetical protein